jgi:putative glutamine amidotransferase
LSKPLIGITTGRQIDRVTSIRVPDTYVRAVLRAGGMPLLIPVGIPETDLAELRDQLNGVIFTGGADVEPARFGGMHHPRVYGVDVERDSLEIALVLIAVRTRLPFLGICRGIQVINVALGGTLYTHLADQLKWRVTSQRVGNQRGKSMILDHEHHEGNHYDYLAHSVTVERDSQLGRILNVHKIEVNSLHHQGVDQLASGLRAVAHSADQLVEGVEIRGHPFAIGVQWHPEWMPESVKMQALLQAFVQAAAIG